VEGGDEEGGERERKNNEGVEMKTLELRWKDTLKNPRRIRQ